MTAKGQRYTIIALMALIIGILLFPEKFRKAVLEVVTEDTAAGRTHDSESETRPEPQRITRLHTEKAVS